MLHSSPLHAEAPLPLEICGHGARAQLSRNYSPSFDAGPRAMRINPVPMTMTRWLVQCAHEVEGNGSYGSARADPRSSEYPALRRDHWAVGRPSVR